MLNTAINKNLESFSIISNSYEMLLLVNIFKWLQIDGGDLISQLTSHSFCWARGIDNFYGDMVDEADPDKGFSVGLSRQRWSNLGVRKQLSLGINFEQDNPGRTRKVIPAGSGS